MKLYTQVKLLMVASSNSLSFFLQRKIIVLSELFIMWELRNNILAAYRVFRYYIVVFIMYAYFSATCFF